MVHIHQHIHLTHLPAIQLKVKSFASSFEWLWRTRDITLYMNWRQLRPTIIYEYIYCRCPSTSTCHLYTRICILVCVLTNLNVELPVALSSTTFDVHMLETRGKQNVRSNKKKTDKIMIVVSITAAAAVIPKSVWPCIHTCIDEYDEYYYRSCLCCVCRHRHRYTCICESVTKLYTNRW